LVEVQKKGSVWDYSAVKACGHSSSGI
jgi:hypothetical protein